uniref:KIB1-4 beta-propeller domain-containing protein n=1 Tax=Oryza meridionalis TaxID=40149 RepID=A0A0E0D659_9ORYZ
MRIVVTKGKIQSIVAIDEKFYFDISASELGVIKLNPNLTFTTIQLKTLKVSRNCWELALPHLVVESHGRLHLVVYDRNCIRNMCLFEMDFSRLEWCSVDRLYDQVFFVGKLHFTASYSARELGLKAFNQTKVIPVIPLIVVI